ncbi:SAM-dependent methyltransferase [Salinarimonas ramus]|uniref:S-adenosyl-L-methionine-dependent methyltransferase n=1 Tax=Salinarimonas ramus TaxID=690164 RepID=A0A917V267_9HYPH|nr:SAM-dependent methyltransferase [Salinarimonas ramus]GGK25633.1 S-adenosyl-L-methionine-dependent methyltransferase [Salinarimonas ramus]
MQPVSYTAQWTAAIRALETERAEDALFSDPLARALSEPDGFRLIERYRGAGVQDFVVIRTRFFDDQAAAALAQAPDLRQVAMIAAGMDTRPFRLDWPADARVYEVDHAPLLDEKARRLSTLGATARVARAPVPADLAVDWVEPLKSAGFDPQAPTLWLVEGLLFFLTDDQARHVLSTCRSLSAPGSRLVVDMTSAALLRSPFTRAFLATLEADGNPWRFGTDEPEAFLETTGWTPLVVKEPGAPGAGEGRWPYTPQPREVTGAARSWLVVAEPGAGGAT